MKVSEKLQQIFPTVDSLLTARQNYKSWKAMAGALGLSSDAILSRRKALGIIEDVKPERRYADYLTDEEIALNIREMFESRNVVTRYKTTNLDEFLKDPCGDEFLELVGVEQGGL